MLPLPVVGVLVGLCGAVGDAGVDGIDGAPGDDGVAGIDGEPGVWFGAGGVFGPEPGSGIVGEPGVAGVPGVPGAPGVPGVFGVPGVLGVLGVLGAPGAPPAGTWAAAGAAIASANRMDSFVLDMTTVRATSVHADVRNAPRA